MDLVLENEDQRHLLTLSRPLDEGATRCGNGPDDRMFLNLDPSKTAFLNRGEANSVVSISSIQRCRGSDYYELGCCPSLGSRGTIFEVLTEVCHVNSWQFCILESIFPPDVEEHGLQRHVR